MCSWDGMGWDGMDVGMVRKGLVGHGGRVWLGWDEGGEGGLYFALVVLCERLCG